MSHGVRCQIWLTEGERLIIGEEGAGLLASIAERGSLQEAAAVRGMSDGRAREIIAQIEEVLGARIVVSGDRCNLTAEGNALLDEHQNKKRRADEQLAHAFRNPTLTADGVVMVDGRIVLVRRGREPGRGKYALPGGFVEHGERAEDCAVREVMEETGLRTEPLGLVGLYSDPGRDPRGHIVSAVFHLRVVGGELRAGDDADEVSLYDLDSLPELAFDHAKIITDHLRATGKRR
ncbi:MAG: NUDIX domain-containing protein [Methanomassiliicoccus sp.]|nr:NUDIX domain-containing protein [Methanomassiliicoccus sp.]